VFLDSGLHHPGQSRYDILSAQPYMRLVTRGALTEINEERIELSREDPFDLLRERLATEPGSGGTLPFCGGAIGYFGFNGNVDSCIALRCAVLKNGHAYFQAGAGIVSDSDPQREYDETVIKARAMMKALAMASQIKSQ